ncbi:hypothetical protein [Pseudonocardia sp. GCM10023141]|uniref:hypothetical protein n=1 Tax=Pseudonocardia sp. GCM10023141 TaxID=3252653 RepID=UPI003614018B
MTPYPAVKPPLIAWDVTLSVIALALTGLLVAGGVVIGFFSVAFLDHCPPERCSAEGAWTAVGIALLVAVVIGLAGMVVAIVRITRRRISWPFAVGALLLCVATLVAGIAGYAAAVGG